MIKRTTITDSRGDANGNKTISFIQFRAISILYQNLHIKYNTKSNAKQTQILWILSNQYQELYNRHVKIKILGVFGSNMMINRYLWFFLK